MKTEIKDRIDKIEKGILPEGYKKTKMGIIPEDWEVKKLGEISNYISSGKTKNKEGLGKYVIYGSTGKIGYSNEYDYEGIKILIARVGANAGLINIVDGKYGVSDNTLILDLKSNNNILYIYYYLKIFDLNRLVFGTGQPLITGGGVKKLDTPIPALQEQEEITDILSTWDKAIETIEKLIIEKETQKKGLVQELLTGETRLPGFDGEWEEVKLGDLGERYNGLTGKTKKDFGDGFKFITYLNIFTNSKIDLDVYDLVKINKDDKQNKVRYGDIFFTVSSETPDEVGMSSVLLDEIEEDIYLNSFCFGFRLKNFLTLLPEYARFYFRSDNIRNKIYKLAQGSTRFNLSKIELMKIKLSLPPLPEQKAIANILSTADKEIELLNKLLTNKKEEKKGLMQLLLTGIVRV